MLLPADGPERLPGADRAGPRHARLHAADDAAPSPHLAAHDATGGDDERQSLRRAAGHQRDATRGSGSPASPPYALIHDREIANRIDDSVVRIMGGQSAPPAPRPRLSRPAPITLPPGFEAAPELLAFGGELKATFCLVKDGEAILSQHQGDLEDAATFDDYRKNLALYRELFDHAPEALDRRPPSRLSLDQARAASARAPRACRSSRCSITTPMSRPASPRMAYPLDAPPVLGIVLDGLGLRR